MKIKTFNPVSQKRREFLAASKSVGILGAIAVLLGKGGSVDGTALADKEPKQPTQSGYRETEHIRKYYDSIRY